MSDNIKVVVKVRPLISREIEEKLSYQWRIKNNSLYQIDHTGKEFGQTFTFDKVYDESSKTSDVYNDVAKPIVEAATAGFNGTIFAYGQTSSGKTYTMSGIGDSPGIIQMAVLNLFELIKSIPDRDFLVRVSYLEIYNETVKDLFDVDREHIKIHETLNGIKVDVLEKVTPSPEDVLEAMKMGEVNRQTGSTNMNEKSSRSHSIFQITIESREHIEGEEESGSSVKVSQLNLVDLAGSERAGQTGATGIRFKEGTHINKSLSALALVIKQLSEDPYRYANYRDSKLTRILQNSLGGNAKTSIICAVTPAAVEETISTLQFANRAKAIKNKPEVNEVATNATMIQSLTKQLSKLKTQLETKKSIEQDNYNLQKQIANLQKLILNGFGQPRSVDPASGRRKNEQLRRKTISTLRSIEEQSPPNVRQFRTPILKYNPALIPGVSEIAAVQSRNTLPTLPEEPCERAITPPPHCGHKSNNDVIVLDSDDDDVDTNTVCSPYHKCYGVTKTPPCILRRNAKLAEKSLEDIIDFTEREKMYPPTTVELLERVETKATVISNLKDEIESLNKQSKDKDVQLELLKAKVKKAEEDMKNILDVKAELETKCKDYDTRLTDCEVSYETLKQKAKRREEELLSLLEDQVEKNKREDTVLTRKLNKDINNFLDMSKDISLVESENESILVSNQSEQNLQKLVSDLQAQVVCKNNTIIELEANLNAHKQRIDHFENSNQELHEIIASMKDKLSYFEVENLLFKSTIETLNSTIKSQKQNLESANNDMESYNSLIQELQIKLTNKDRIIGLNFNDNTLQSMIDNEKQFIANNENIKNIVQCFKLTLDSKSKEIGDLRCNLQDLENTKNTELVAELNAKVGEIDSLNEKVIKLNDQIKEHVSNINNLIQEKTNWTSLEANLSEKITSLTKSNEKLQSINKDKDVCIEKLKKELESLSLSLMDKAATEAELLDTNQKLLRQTEDMSNTVTKLENVIQEKSNTIDLLQEKYQNIQEHCDKAKAAVNKLQNILSLFKNDIQIIPENISDFINIISTLHSTIDMLKVIVVDYIKNKDGLIISNNELSLLLSRKDSELTEKQTELTQLQKTVEHMTTEKEAISRNLQELKLEVEDKSKQIGNMVKELEEIKVNHEVFKHDLSSRHNSSMTSEKIESLEKEIDALNNLIKSKEGHFVQTLLEKDSDLESLKNKLEEVHKELAEKCITIDTMTQQITDTYTRMNQDQNDRHQLLQNVFTKVNSITSEFKIENNMSCQFIDANINIYEQIMLILEKIRNYIKNMGLQNENCDSQQKNTDQNLIEATNEIRELTKQNMELREKLYEIENKNVKYLTDLEKIQIENKDLNKNLIASQSILEQLKHEVALKATELDIMELKAKGWKEDISNFDRQIKEQMEEMNIENERLKICICQRKETEDLDLKNNLEITNAHKCPVRDLSPPSLLTICCNKIFESIQPKDSETKSVTSAISSTDIELYRRHKCQCEELSMNLDMVKKQCKNLVLNVQHLETENERLHKEREEVRAELELLTEPALELQKKIANHKTNLSILTATTYAENKLLKSQVKVLQHHHTRSDNVCQRDIPAFKKQLQDLLLILKGNYDDHSTSIKRYSLPDVLENNTMQTNLKNESTFDGDMLMLDSNVTLTTIGDNTFVGYNHTCLDMSQSLHNEVDCQINDLNLTTENLLEKMKCDNKTVFEKLQLLKQENNNLREQVKNFSDSTNRKDQEVQISFHEHADSKIGHNVSSQPEILCIKCKEFDKLQTNYHRILQDVDNINKKFAVVTSEKDVIEVKYKQLSSEVLSIDELVSKINKLEKNHDEKVQEITILNKTLLNKNKQLKALQEENDTLSTQVIENVSEVDDLSKKIENYVQNNTELTQKYLKLEVELQLVRKAGNDNDRIDCPQCILKSETTHSRQRKSISVPHTKLNRSYSDSDTSSRYNKICTLQNELHAGREDCLELTEDVTTIKNHLDRSNLSMDLDITMGDPSVFTCNKELPSDLQPNTCNMPEIPEECHTDLYSIDKAECVNYYIQHFGKTHETLDQNMKIIEVMKMLYNGLITKHTNEVENLVNKLKDFDETKNQMHEQIISLTQECSTLKTELLNKKICFKDVNALMQIKNNLNLIQSELFNANNADIYFKLLDFFKDNVLRAFDSEFETSTTSVFQVLISAVLNKNENDLKELIGKYSILQEQFEKLTTELKFANDNINQMNIKLNEKEKEYTLLKAQKDSIFEISQTVTMDIIQKEREINKLILQSCQKLTKQSIVDIEQISFDNTVCDNIHLLFEQISKKIELKLQSEKEISSNELKRFENILKIKETELTHMKTCNEQLKHNNDTVTLDLVDKEEKLKTLIDLHENLKQVYESKVKENVGNINLIEKLSEEVENMKEIIKAKEGDIVAVCEKQNEVAELRNTITNLKEEIQNIKTINEAINKESNACKIELDNTLKTIEENKTEINKMTSDMLVLRESIKDSAKVVDSLKNEAKALMEQNSELTQKLDEKCQECFRIQSNMKTLTKTIESLNKMICRLKKQKEEDDALLNDKHKQIEELTKVREETQKEFDKLQSIIKTTNDEIEQLKKIKESLEARVAELELASESEKRRLSIDSIADASRRRRQSLYDSKRLSVEGGLQFEDHNNVEAVFESRVKPDDLFMDVDGDISNRSTPIRLSKGRDSLLSRTDQSDKEDEHPSRPSSVVAARRRRQSIHDLHRSVIDSEARTRNTPSPCDYPSKLLQEDGLHFKSEDKAHSSDSEICQLKEQLASCNAELDDLKEKYRELDDECETCATYLKERDKQCMRLFDEKKELEKKITELQAKVRPPSAESSGVSKRSTANASVNTDEDWTNLHSLVVDRMSYDAEVEKNKKLTKAIEELRCKKQELQNGMARMQQAMKTHHDLSRDERERLNRELYTCKEELEELRESYKELDDECEMCSQMLKERDAQLHKLMDTKDVLEAKLKEYEDSECRITLSVRKKRQNVHDQNRNSSFEVRDASTETREDFLSYIVERDESSRKITDEAHAKELQQLKLNIEKLSQQKATLEQQLVAVKKAAAEPTYVATGSAIVQNQQITDVMKENHKLKKMNAKLLNLCKKRVKNRENEEPVEQG